MGGSETSYCLRFALTDLASEFVERGGGDASLYGMARAPNALCAAWRYIHMYIHTYVCSTPCIDEYLSFVSHSDSSNCCRDATASLDGGEKYLLCT